MPNPSISVVIAVRNGATTLQSCLDSVFEQTYREVEVVVMDGASNDGTQAVLEANTSKIQYWESVPDRGIHHAWNKALGHVRGDWILFLGADDRLRDPTVLSRAAPSLRAAEGRYQVVYGSVDLVDSNGRIRSPRPRPWPEARRDFMRTMAIPHQGTFHHRDLFERHGGFDERFRISGDYELLLRELRSNDALFISDLVVVDMGAGGLSDRPESHLLMAREFHRARRMHGMTWIPDRLYQPYVRDRSRTLLTRMLGPRLAGSIIKAYRLVLRRGRTETAD